MTPQTAALVPLPPVPPAPVSPPIPQPTVVAGGVPAGYRLEAVVATFQELMTHKVTPAIQAKVINTPELLALCKEHGGVEALPALVPAHPNIPKIGAALDALVTARSKAV
jgi:hypothetical protein